MKQKVVSIGDINVANDLPFVLFGGMNVLERNGSNTGRTPSLRWRR